MSIVTVKLIRLPQGSVVRGKVTDNGYQITGIAGSVVAYSATDAAVYRVGDRIDEEDAENINRHSRQRVSVRRAGDES